MNIVADWKRKNRMIGVGFSSSKASLERLPGWEQESWAYHGDDGKSFFGESQGQGKPYGPTFAANDTIGCGVNFATGCAFFTRNGVFLGRLRIVSVCEYCCEIDTDLFLIGNAFRELRNVKLYPSVGMKKQPGAHLRANFGQKEFMFDINGMMKVGFSPLVCMFTSIYTNLTVYLQKERLTIQKEINSTNTSNLHPQLGEDELIQELVAQFLAHDGYVETARAFAREVKAESRSLQNDRGTPLKDYDVEEDLDGINRQSKIRFCMIRDALN
jgi:hypothetical protein